MNYKEEASQFICHGDQLMAILARPDDPGSIGVLIVVGGPQTRVGSHRQFVYLARGLAAHGFPTLRFDYRGMGDSCGTPRTFETVDADIGAAIDELLSNYPTLRGVVLWGLCDAASAALMYWQARQDGRVVGLCLLNPWVRSPTTEARARVKYYYLARIRQPEFWRKLFGGRLRLRETLSSLTGNLRLARTSHREGDLAQKTFQEIMADSLGAFPFPVKIILSENDHTAKEFIEYGHLSARFGSALQRDNISCDTVRGADHTFSSAAWRKEVEDLTLAWIQQV